MVLFSRFFERRDTSFQQLWGADLDAPASPFNTQRVTREQVMGLPAVLACVRLLADTVATLPLDAYERTGTQRLALDPQPDWIERPIPRDPSVTRVVHFQQVVSALMFEGNNFTLATPSIFDPAELRVLDPRRVEIRRGPDSTPLYDVRDHAGGIVDTFDWTRIVHIPLIRLPGELRGLSPLEAERQLFSGAIALEQLGERFARNGLWLSAVVETAADMNQEQADELIARFEKKWTGTRNSGKVGVLTNGATLKPLTVTPEQAQFLETRQYDDERIFRLYRCPPALVGMTKEGATSNASAVAQALAFEKHTVRPLVELIEIPYSILLGPRRYLKFNTKGLLRADPKTQAELYHYALTDKWRTVDEVRGLEDEQPFGGADGGLLQTPNNNAPGDASGEAS